MGRRKRTIAIKVFIDDSIAAQIVFDGKKTPAGGPGIWHSLGGWRGKWPNKAEVRRIRRMLKDLCRFLEANREKPHMIEPGPFYYENRPGAD